MRTRIGHHGERGERAVVGAQAVATGLAKRAPAMAARPAVMQKTSTFMTLTVAPWVSRATGCRRDPSRGGPCGLSRWTDDDHVQDHEDEQYVVEALVGVEVPPKMVTSGRGAAMPAVVGPNMRLVS